MSFFDNLPTPPKKSKLQFWQHFYQGFRPTHNTEFTIENYPDLSGKVCVITGMNTGIGFEVVDILLSKNCNVYGVVRTDSKGLKAKEELLKRNPETKGSLEIISGCDLSNFDSVVETGLKLQDKLKDKTINIVLHNAGLMSNFNDRSNSNGIELMFATNVMGPQLLQSYIDPLFLKKDDLIKRIVWVSSCAHMVAPDFFGFNEKDPKYLEINSRPNSGILYGQSKACNILQAKAYALKHDTEKYGIISTSVFPGILTTELARDYPRFVQYAWSKMFYTPKFGAISELYACFYPQLKSGDYIVPFGKTETPRTDIDAALTNGVCLKFWDYIQNEIKDFIPKN
ncbi:hypothetical protein QEN19_000526 [Hanseniaspora menglaensis]